jgi:phospholipid/cholesterol/gamma-HCH transport system substrate-binding protein
MRYSKEFKVGILVTAAIAIFYVGFNYLKGIEVFNKSAKYYAIYENIDGLTVSNPVVINGLSVGRVSSIRLDQKNNNQIVVELQVVDGLVLGDSTVALLINSDFLGSKAIELQIGPLINLIESGDTLIGSIDPSITEFLKDNALPVANSLGVTLRAINNILDDFSGNGPKVNDMVDQVQATTHVIRDMAQENRRNVRVLTQNLTELSAELNLISKEISPLMGKIDVVADSLQQLSFSESFNKINQSLDELNLFLAKLNENDGTLQKMLDDEALYNNLNKSAASLDSLLKDMKDNPNRYVHFSLFGRKNQD